MYEKYRSIATCSSVILNLRRENTKDRFHDILGKDYTRTKRSNILENFWLDCCFFWIANCSFPTFSINLFPLFPGFLSLSFCYFSFSIQICFIGFGSFLFNFRQTSNIMKHFNTSKISSKDVEPGTYLSLLETSGVQILVQLIYITQLQYENFYIQEEPDFYPAYLLFRIEKIHCNELTETTWKESFNNWLCMIVFLHERPESCIITESCLVWEIWWSRYQEIQFVMVHLDGSLHRDALLGFKEYPSSSWTDHALHAHVSLYFAGWRDYAQLTSNSSMCDLCIVKTCPLLVLCWP